MTDVDKAVIAKLKVGSEHFEVLVTDTKSAMLFREGKIPIDDVLVAEYIFKDAKRGTHASEHEMEKLFKTSDVKEVASHIIKKGEVQMSTEYKNSIMEEKRKQIINLIHRNAVDPKTNLPHPPIRIENAMQQAKINIDYSKSAEEQLLEIVKKLQPIIPIKYETREIELHIPVSFAPKCFTTLKQNSKILSSKWEGDGSLTAVIEVPAGMQSDLFEMLNKIARGQVESKVVRTK